MLPSAGSPLATQARVQTPDVIGLLVKRLAETPFETARQPQRKSQHGKAGLTAAACLHQPTCPHPRLSDAA